MGEFVRNEKVIIPNKKVLALDLGLAEKFGVFFWMLEFLVIVQSKFNFS